MTKAKDLTGRRYGKLTVKENAGRDKGGNVLWRCECDCGGWRTVRSGTLGEGKATSCGCQSKNTNAALKPTKPCKQCGKIMHRGDDMSFNWKRRVFCDHVCRSAYGNEHSKKDTKDDRPRDSGPRRAPAVFTDIHNAFIYGRPIGA